MTYIPALLRRQVVENANDRCEYCRIPQDFSYMPHEIDHIVAEKHGGETVSENLCLSCWLCNRHKGSDLTSLHPETKQIIRLFHPRKDRWGSHFQLEDVSILSITDIGLVTVNLLQMNKQERHEERRILLRLGLFP